MAMAAMMTVKICLDDSQNLFVCQCHGKLTEVLYCRGRVQTLDAQPQIDERYEYPP